MHEDLILLWAHGLVCIQYVCGYVSRSNWEITSKIQLPCVHTYVRLFVNSLPKCPFPVGGVWIHMLICVCVCFLICSACLCLCMSVCLSVCVKWPWLLVKWKKWEKCVWESVHVANICWSLLRICSVFVKSNKLHFFLFLDQSQYLLSSWNHENGHVFS